MALPSIRRFDLARDGAAVCRSMSLAFGGTLEGADDYMTLVGHDAMRVLDDGIARVEASLARIDMGQWFGGRSVPMAGIAAVAVPPEARGRKLALTLMQACMRELASEGVPLSCLYASTQPLYRQVGFEQAGARFETRVSLRHLTEGTRDLPIEALDMRDWAATGAVDPRLVECYRDFASRFNGTLDRCPFLWRRVCRNREKEFHGFAVVPSGPGGPIEAYLFLSQMRHPTGRHDITLSDCAFTTARGAHRLVGFLRDFTSMGLTLSLWGGTCHALTPFLRQHWIEIGANEYWLLRIVDVRRAIEARGYAPGICIDVPIELTDDVVAANSGRWRVVIDSGRASVQTDTGHDASVRMSIRGMAALYSGHQSPRQLALGGHAEGPDHLLAALGAAFAGTAPWMTDFF